METRHKQTSNISILQVNHLRWPQCATAQRDERREQPLKLGVIRQMKGHLEIIFSQVNKRLAKFGARVEILKSAPLPPSLFFHLKNIRKTTSTYTL